MGDRGNIAVVGGGKRVYFYGHWAGSEMPEIVRAALARGKGRWNDAPYLARIIFCQMVAPSDLMAETGYGISTEPGDNGYPILVVDCDKQEVNIETDTREGYGYAPAGDAKAFGFAAYAALPEATWSTLDSGR